MSAVRKDVSRGVYSSILRSKAAAIGAVRLAPATSEICEDVPDTSYLAVRNAKRLAQFRERLHNQGRNVFNNNGKVVIQGKHPDLYVA